MSKQKSNKEVVSTKFWAEKTWKNSEMYVITERSSGLTESAISSTSKSLAVQLSLKLIRRVREGGEGRAKREKKSAYQCQDASQQHQKPTASSCVCRLC